MAALCALSAMAMGRAMRRRQHESRMWVSRAGRWPTVTKARPQHPQGAMPWSCMQLGSRVRLWVLQWRARAWKDLRSEAGPKQVTRRAGSVGWSRVGHMTSGAGLVAGSSGAVGASTAVSSAVQTTQGGASGGGAQATGPCVKSDTWRATVVRGTGMCASSRGACVGGRVTCWAGSAPRAGMRRREPGGSASGQCKETRKMRWPGGAAAEGMAVQREAACSGSRWVKGGSSAGGVARSGAGSKVGVGGSPRWAGAAGQEVGPVQPRVGERGAWRWGRAV